MECELCGSGEASCKAEIEGVILSVCEKCAKYGKKIIVKNFPEKKENPPSLSKIEKIPVEDFSQRVKKLREEKNLSQEELASKIKEKISVVKRIEEGWIPEEKVIEKLEKFFGVKLRKEVTESNIKPRKEKSVALTIGDIVEVK